tara:strand:- start:28087 stop:29136 length:1050 start_codon:yes stop_codon:yes gene_type:complete
VSRSLSFITPHFNQFRHLKELGELFLHWDQNRSVSSDISSQLEWEWIIIDDFSENQNELQSLVKSWNHPQIQLVLLSQNSGPSHARNKGITCARGRELIFVDADIEVNLDKVIEKEIQSPFCAGLHSPSQGSFFTRYKNDYMNAIFHPFTDEGGALECSFIYGALCGWPKDLAYKWPQDLRIGEDTFLAGEILRSGQTIQFRDDLLLTHKKSYRFLGLLRNDFRVPFYFAKAYKFRLKNKGQMKASFSHTNKYQLYSILFSGVFLIGLIYSLVSLLIRSHIQEQYLSSLLAASILLWFKFNIPLFKRLLINQRPLGALGRVGLTLIDQWIMGFGILFGLTYFFLFEKAK